MDGTIRLDRATVTNEPEATRREWLVTNGTGSFAMGTVAGVRTRSYHGLLVAAVDPPVDRRVLVTSLEESAVVEGEVVALFALRFGEGRCDPRGFEHLEQFRLDGTTAVWAFRIGPSLLEKRIWMEDGADTTFVRYAVADGPPVDLVIDAYVDHRDFHAVTTAGEETFQIDVEGSRAAVRSADGPVMVIEGAGAKVEARNRWRRGHRLAVETYRGLDDRTDDLHVARFSVRVDGPVTLTASRGEPASVEGALDRRAAHELDLLARAGAVPSWVERLVLAADQFVVRRRVGEVEGRSIIAGYPWFADWGRDTMIALPGIALVTGRPELAASILRTYAAHLDRGMLPNRFPDVGEAPEYNTVDATLWFLDAVDEYHRSTGDDDLVVDLFDRLVSIVDHHEAGTRHGIRVDPADGLISQGEPGVQLTWMDAKVDDWVVTPRIGKPVEVNALWHHGLRVLARLAPIADRDPDRFTALADRVAASFDRFWDGRLGHLVDVLDGPDGDDPSLRPNQLIALRLGSDLVQPERARSIVAICQDRLVTPMGLRTLDPSHADYEPRYGGDRRTRDGQYHQGTVWPWLIGPFCSAHFRVHADSDAILRFLRPLVEHLADHGLGSIAEIADGDPPHEPRGTIAQAWSVAEILRVWREIGGE
jgi:predicted glycogen debranching enzyme